MTPEQEAFWSQFTPVDEPQNQQPSPSNNQFYDPNTGKFPEGSVFNEYQPIDDTKFTQDQSAFYLGGRTERVLPGKYEGAGECVGGARQARPDLPFNLITMQDKLKYKDSDTPLVGSTAIIPAGLPGHLATVIGIHDGRIYTRDVNADGHNGISIRSYKPDEIKGYIRGDMSKVNNDKIHQYQSILDIPESPEDKAKAQEDQKQVEEFSQKRTEEATKSDLLGNNTGAIASDFIKGQADTVKGLAKDKYNEITTTGPNVATNPIASSAVAFGRGFGDAATGAFNLAKGFGKAVLGAGQTAGKDILNLPETLKVIIGKGSPEEKAHVQELASESQGALRDVGQFSPNPLYQFASGVLDQIIKGKEAGLPLDQSLTRGGIQGIEQASAMWILGKVLGSSNAPPDVIAKAKNAGIDMKDIAAFADPNVSLEAKQAALESASKYAGGVSRTLPQDLGAEDLAKFIESAKGIKEGFGQQIGDIVKKLGNNGGRIQVKDLADVIKGKLEEMGIKVPEKGPLTKASFNASSIPNTANAEQNFLRNIWDKINPSRVQGQIGPPTLHVADAINMVRSLGREIDAASTTKGIGATSQGVSKEVFGHVREGINQLADKLGMPELRTANEGYHTSTDLLHEISKKAGENNTNAPDLFRRYESNSASAIKDLFNRIHDFSTQHNIPEGQHLNAKAEVAGAAQRALKAEPQSSFQGRIQGGLGNVLEGAKPNLSLRESLTPLFKKVKEATLGKSPSQAQRLLDVAINKPNWLVDKVQSKLFPNQSVNLTPGEKTPSIVPQPKPIEPTQSFLNKILDPGFSKGKVTPDLAASSIQSVSAPVIPTLAQNKTVDIAQTLKNSSLGKIATTGKGILDKILKSPKQPIIAKK